jgi:hypothetical protein
MLSASKTAAPSGGYNLTNSLRFRASASATLTRTFGSTYTDKTKSTFSVWVKRGKLNDGNGQAFLYYNSSGSSGSFGFAGANSGGTLVNDCISIGNRNATTGSGDYGFQTTALYRDPSAWYHIVIVFDTGQATASNRFKLYVNGVQVTNFVSASYPSQNYQTTALLGGNAVAHQIGFNANTGASNYSDLYLAETNFIDGQALTPSSFGSTNATTGVWQPARYTGTYGTNGFYLNFTDIGLTSGSNAGLGKDFSGNGNYWTTNNISVTAGTTYDSMTDVPTLTSATAANYAVLNPLQGNPSGTGYSVTSGNLNFSSNVANWAITTGTIDMTSGKWYWEVTLLTADSQMHGILATTTQLNNGASTNWVGWFPSGYGYFTDGNKWNNNSGVAYGSSYTVNDTIGIAYDADTGILAFYKNGTSQGTAFTGLSGSFSPGHSGTVTNTFAVNFGQRPFSYTPPTNYKALNTYNLSTGTIVQGSSYMNSVLWTGNGSSPRSFTGWSFSPDFIWIKARSTTHEHALIDSNRGTGSKVLNSNSTAAEWGAGLIVSSFDSNGFTGTTGSVNFTWANANGDTYVGWGWDAGSSTVTNTSGTISSQVRANPTAGFSIVTYTGTGANATVGHGLGVAPKMIITRYRGSESWSVYHTSLGGTKTLYLNLTNAANTTSLAWNNTDPTSTVFSLGSAGTTNTSGSPGMVAYCWAEIAGFSKFGSYTGNGSADGPFVYTGFRPEWVMIKRTVNAGGSWAIYDTARNTYNVANLSLYPNLTSADDTYNVLDFTSNGFKIRTSTLGVNQIGDTFIYAAFAENPFKNALAR